MVGRQDCESFATAPSIMHLTNGVEANSVAVPAASVFMDVSFSELTLTIINATNTPSAVVDVGKKKPSEGVGGIQEEALECSPVGSEVVYHTVLLSVLFWKI